MPWRARELVRAGLSPSARAGFILTDEFPALRDPGRGALVRDALRDKTTEYSLSVILHSGRVSITLGRYSLPHFDEGCGLGEEIHEAVQKILKEARWLNRDE
jgi:hypothetical protein